MNTVTPKKWSPTYGENIKITDNTINKMLINAMSIVNNLLILAVIVLSIISIVKNVKRKNTARWITSIVMLVVSVITFFIMTTQTVFSNIRSEINIIPAILCVAFNVIFIISLIIMIAKKNKEE